MGTAKGKRAGLPYRDELPTISICPLKASGALPLDSRSIVIFGDREVRVRHSMFPGGGSRAFFICPGCDRQAIKLRLLSERIVCQRCDGGLIYRCQNRDPTNRIARLREALYGPNPVKHFRRRLEQALRRALIHRRQLRLNRAD